MESDVEGLVERVVRLEVVPVEEPRDENEVARRGDRQQLGEALHDPEGEGLPVSEPSGHLADPCRGQHDGQRKQQ